MANNGNGGGIISSARNSTNGNINYDRLMVPQQQHNAGSQGGGQHQQHSMTAANSNTNSQVVLSNPASKLGLKKRVIAQNQVQAPQP